MARAVMTGTTAFAMAYTRAREYRDLCSTRRIRPVLSNTHCVTFSFDAACGEGTTGGLLNTFSTESSGNPVTEIPEVVEGDTMFHWSQAAVSQRRDRL